MAHVAGVANGGDTRVMICSPTFEDESGVSRASGELEVLWKPYFDQVDGDLARAKTYRKIVDLTWENFRQGVKDNKLLTAGKVVFLAACSYGLKNFSIGIAAGEVLFGLTHTSDLSSSDPDVQINAGGIFTNAAQNVQFALDSLLIFWGMGYVTFNTAYVKAMHKIVRDCYEPYLNKASLSAAVKNQLFLRMERELARY